MTVEVQSNAYNYHIFIQTSSKKYRNEMSMHIVAAKLIM